MYPDIIYEDDELLVVSKPAGMIVNKADTAKDQLTLQEWVEKRLENKSKTNVLSKEQYVVDGYNKLDEFINRGGIVHRLDKETSGVVLIAKTPEAFINLQNQFKSGEVHKAYVTLVHGKVEAKEGRIEAPIGRLPWNRMRFGVYPEGRAAISKYRVVAYKNSIKDPLDISSLVEVYPETGRTHQIRVHFKHIGHPVFGDELYAGRKRQKKDRKSLNRHFLHAIKISLKHPKSQKAVMFESPLPQELAEFLNTLQTYEDKN